MVQIDPTLFPRFHIHPYASIILRLSRDLGNMISDESEVRSAKQAGGGGGSGGFSPKRNRERVARRFFRARVAGCGGPGLPVGRPAAARESGERWAPPRHRCLAQQARALAAPRDHARRTDGRRGRREARSPAPLASVHVCTGARSGSTNMDPYCRRVLRKFY